MREPPTLVLAHGAGAPQTHPWMVATAKAIARCGIDVVTFDFLYTAAGRRAPDKNDRLEATWRAALGAVRRRLSGGSAGRVYIGGKSMGGRIASQIASQPDIDVAGVVLLGYPLHPPGQPLKLRAAHLARVRAPMLFVQGSRDAFGTPDELAPILAGLPARTRLYVVDGGDHSFAVGRVIDRSPGGPARARAKAAPSGPRTSRAAAAAEVIARVADEVAHFVT
jgi:predicted alpha/beta-hydrolase family hydrolase